MIIRIALIAGLLLCLAYAFLQRRKSALVSIAISFTSVAGIYFVVFPEQTTELAQMLGVGRGTDLILYCWIVITLVISMNLRFNLLGLQEQLTELVRELALRAPRRNESNGAQQAVARSTAISLDSNVEAPAADQRSGSSATKALSVPAASDRGGVWPVMTGLIVFALVVVRTMPLAGPFIWDEGIYVQQAHFGSDFGKVYPNALFADHPMPNHLFLAIYGSTFHLDTQYMQAARILNALFLAFAGVFIFAVARRVLRVHAAFLLAVLSAAGAITIYAAMFMPEPLYFLGFWIAVWACTRTIERSLIRSAIDVGAVLGVMMLVKPHAAMLLVGFSAYFLVFPLIVKPDLKWTQGVASVVACALSFLVVWAIGTMVITGHVQLPSVLSYAPLGGVVLKSAGLWGQLRDIVFNLSGHAAALSLLLGAAIYGLFFRVAADIARPRSPRRWYAPASSPRWR